MSIKINPLATITMPNDKSNLSKITLSDIQVTSSHPDGVTDYHGINMLKYGQDFKITANVDDPDGILPNPALLNIIAEQVINGKKVINDERFKAVMIDGVATIDASDGFADTGNFIISQERLNEGLKNIGLSFQVEFDRLEFDIQRN